jgi:serine/threonine protein kinase/Tol biopolymer transport system component
MIGQTISHFRILEKIGEGGMGVVYKAEDTNLKRTVALKFLPRGLEAHEPERARFLQEAQAASAINHPNICTIYDIAEHDGQQFIVMEYVDGKTLRQIVPIQKTQAAIDYAIQIGEALQEAHSKGIVHRDVKTDNIMVNSKNQIKVMDFGLAKLKGSLKLTKTSSTVGTLAYMAPEQIQGGEVDARSDIFSFGVVLYEMLTGHMPFRGEHEAAMVYSIVNEEPTPIQKHIPDISSELVHIVSRALEKDPEDRYQTVHEMVIDLRRLKKQTSRVSRVVSILPTTESQVTPSTKSHEGLRLGFARIVSAARARKWTLVGVIVLILCFISWMLFHSEPRRAMFKAGRSSQLTSEAGIEIDPALSPDGKMIAYSAYRKGKMRVHVKQVSGGRTLCLTEELPGYQRFPSWSTDGSHIAFCSSEPTLSLYVVTALGGAPMKIAEGVSGCAWSPDGKQIVYRHSRDTVFTQAVDGGEGKRLAVAYEPHSFCWSPDGSRISFVSGNSAYLSSTFVANIAPSSLYVVSVADGKLSQITDNTSLNTSPVWTSDNTHLLFVSNRDGTRDIYELSVDRSGRPEGGPQRLTTGLNVYTIGLSADLKNLAYSVLTYSANVWSIRIPERNSVSVTDAVQVTTGNQAIEGLAVSRDGQWLAYDSNREGNQDIYKISLKGGEPIQITTDPNDDFLPSWSPDGRMIAFYSFRTGNRDLFVMSSDGSHQQQITHDPAQERYPDWSPDGNQLVFYSDKTGRQELYVVSKSPRGTGWEEPRQLTHEGGEVPRWSPDGALIAYVTGGKLCIVSPKGGSPKVLVESTDPSRIPEPAFPAWSSDNRTVYYKAFDGSQQSSIWAVPISGGVPQLLVRFDNPARQSNRLEFASDGKRFFFTISKYESDIWKMELITEK